MMQLKDWKGLILTMANNKRKTKMQFTKRIIIVNNYTGLVFIGLSYLLAFLGKPEVAIDLSIVVCKEICAVNSIYCLKSFFETREEEKLKFEKEKFGFETMFLNDEDINNE